MRKVAAEQPPIKSLRERLLTSKLGQVEAALASRSDELQVLLRDGLSPAKLDQRQFELDALRDLKANLINGLEVVARQQAAEIPTRFAEDDVEEEPVGPFRSQRAYLDNLQRERAKLAPLSRDQWDRARFKSKDAKRPRSLRGRDVDPDTLFASAHPTWYTQPMKVASYRFAQETLTGYDPCVDQKRVRREVMFAQRSAGIGYRVRHEWKPC